MKKHALERTDGAELFAWTSGDGPRAVVLLHGFPFDHTMWDSQIESLSDVGRIVAPDLRGLGESGVGGGGGRGLAAYADDVVAWLDHFRIDRAVVAGLSMGGYVAFEIWRRARARITALVLLDTKAEADSPEAKEARVRAREAIREGGMSAVGGGMVEQVLGETTRHRRPEVVKHTRRMILGTRPDGAMAALDAMRGRPDSTPDLPGIDVPTLVLVGEEDSLTPPETARAMAAAIPGAELRIVPGAGHVSSLENPGAVTGALRSFLERILA